MRFKAPAIFLVLTIVAGLVMLGRAGLRLARISASCRQAGAIASELEPALMTQPGPPVEEPVKQKEACRRIVAAWEQVPEGRDFSPAILSQ